MSLTRLISPLLTFAAPLIILIVVLSLNISPWATLKANQYKDLMESRDDLSNITPSVFKESDHSERVYFIESYNELGNVIKNVFVQTMQLNQLGVIVASSGYRESNDANDSYLILENGRRYEGVRGTSTFKTTEFKRYALKLEPNELAKSSPQVQATSSLSLLKEPTLINQAELQWRLSMPITALILCLLAIPLSFVDQRSGKSANLIMALFIYIIYNNGLSVMQAWIIQGRINPHIGMWAVHGVFLLLALFLFYRRYYHLPLLPSIRINSVKDMPAQ